MIYILECEGGTQQVIVSALSLHFNKKNVSITMYRDMYCILGSLPIHSCMLTFILLKNFSIMQTTNVDYNTDTDRNTSEFVSLCVHVC